MMIYLNDYKAHIKELKQSSANASSILNVYKQALFHWKDLNLWIEYLLLAAETLQPAMVVQEFESALMEVGVRFDGASVWELFLDYCTSHQLLEQAELIERRSKSIINAKTDSTDKQVIEEYHFLRSFEDHLSDVNSFLQYTKAESNRPSPNFARIRCIYERALILFPNDLELWRQFLLFNQYSNQLSTAYLRALKIFPDNVDMAIGYLRALEKSKTSINDIQVAFRQLPVNLQTSLAYLGILRRQDSSSLMIVDQCKQLIGQINHYRLDNFMVSLLVSLNKTEEALNHWECIIKANSNSCSFWLQFLSFAEQYYPSMVRNLYRRACAAVSDYPETIFVSWLDYENIHGSLQDLEFAEHRITQQRELISKRTTNLNKKRPSEPATSSSSTQEEEEKGKALKVDQETDCTLFLSNLDYSLSQGDLRSFLQSAFGNVASVRMPKDNDKKAGNRPTNNKQHNRGFAYVDFSCSDSYNRALLSDKIPLNGRPIYITQMHKKHNVKITTNKDPKTLFVSKLHHDVSVDDLKLHFSNHSGIKDIRMVQAKSGRSRGCAYIEFDDEESAKQGLVKDGSELGGMKISVAISDPTLKSKTIKSNTQLIPPSLMVKKENVH